MTRIDSLKKILRDLSLALFAVTLFTFIRMQSDKELMVLKAVGMSPKQLMRPVLQMAGVLTLLGYGLGFWVMPWATGQMRVRTASPRARS